MAESYREAARVLTGAKPRTGHASSPIAFLYYHAIELYLKSFLRLHGVTAKKLAGKEYGHDTLKLTQRAEELGLWYMDEDREVFALMADTDAIIRSRYLEVGPFTVPANEALDRVCDSLRQTIGEGLKASGLPVRL